jgi:hypothetical protein
MSISVDINSVNIEENRKEVLFEEFSKQYFLQIKEFLLQEKNN